MKTASRCLKLGQSLALLLPLVAVCTGTARAQQPPAYNYPPEYPAPPSYPYQGQPGYADPDMYEPEFVPPHQFFKMFGRRFGEMFRGIFYGDEPPVGYDRTVPGGRSLDAAPPAYGSHYGPPTGLTVPPEYDPAYPPRYQTETPRYNNAPRYETPPRYEAPPRSVAPRSVSPEPEAPRYQPVPPPQRQSPASEAPAVSSRNALPEPKKSVPKSQSTPPKKYTPPSVTRTTPGQAKVQSQPPPSIPDESKTDADKPASTAQKSSSKESPKSSATTGNNGSFLKGKRTAKPGRVTSPYPPYQELDVTGLASGSLALDPTTQKVFEVP